MNCIIVDDEPLAREAMELLINEVEGITLTGIFNNALSAIHYMRKHPVDLVFLDINMPGITGLEMARELPKEILVIFTTAYTEYAVESYEIEAIDYLVKPIELFRFQKAVDKAIAYHALLSGEKEEKIEVMQGEYMFIKSERRYFKVEYKDILFIEGLKDYSIIQLETQRLITRMNLKNMYELLPQQEFLRTSKSYIVNTRHIDSFDNNDIYIRTHELALGSTYKAAFFDAFVHRKRNNTV